MPVSTSPLKYEVPIKERRQRWLGLLVVVLVLGLSRFYAKPAEFSRENSVSSLAVLVLLALGLLWHFRLHLKVRLVADDEGLTVGTYFKQQRVKWGEVYSFTKDKKSRFGQSGNWRSLRDRNGDVLVQWNRAWCDGDVGDSLDIERRILQELRQRGHEVSNEPVTTA